MDLSKLSIPELLSFYVDVENEFIRHKISRKRGEIVGGYTEMLVCQTLGLRPTEIEMSGYDATDPEDRNKRYQIKGRRFSKRNSQMGAIKRLDPPGFEFFVGVIYKPDFTVLRAAKIPYGVLMELSELRRTTNGHQLSLTNKVIQRDDVEDIRCLCAVAQLLLVA